MVLDSKLKFKLHVEQELRKVTAITWLLRRVIGRKFGLNLSPPLNLYCDTRMTCGLVFGDD